jgi:hypothetical protein
VVNELPILRETDTGPGGMYSRMEEVGYRLHFEETVTCQGGAQSRFAWSEAVFEPRGRSDAMG